MDIVIVGAGEVGYHLAKRFSEEKHNITIIDSDPQKKTKLDEELDVMTILGNGADPKVLKNAAIENSDMFIGATNSDEVNMVSSFVAKEHGVPLTIARLQHVSFFENLPETSKKKLGVDIVINTRVEVARELVRMIEMPGVLNTVTFANNKVQLIEIQVHENDDLVNMELGDFKELRSLISFLIVGIFRDGKFVIPKGHDVVQAKDRLFIVGQRELIPEILGLLGKRNVETKSVMISGGGELGQKIAEILMDKNISVKIVEKDAEKCEYLASKLKKADVIRGECTELPVLEEEGVEKLDVFVAVTDDEEVNVLSTLLAKKAGAQRGIALINRPDYSLLVPVLGIDAVMMPRTVTANAILKYVRKGDILSAASFGEDNAEVMEILVDKSSRVTNIPLEKLGIPTGCLIGAILHNEKTVIPGGDDIIYPDDRVIIFATKSVVPKVEKFFRR